MDAYVFQTRATPDAVYRYAKGETIRLAPLDAAGHGTNPQRIDRPLDFAAVTDHAENIGEVSLCVRPDSEVYATRSCATYRGENAGDSGKDFLSSVRLIADRLRAVSSDEVCGKDGRRCRDAQADPWGEIQRAAERHYDRSPSCAFTTFVAYEYSYSPEFSKVHRNVIFRSEIALERPIHAFYVSEPLSMLRMLRDECNEGKPGCEALAIPHNPNLSDGNMFRAEYPGAMNAPRQARDARLRASMEPVVEMMQIKGDSECRNGLVGVGGPVDELCEFEKMRSLGGFDPPDCEGQAGRGALFGGGCVDRNDFVRTALVAGLAEEERIGANPFEFGFIASTDVHNGTMGDVREDGLMSRGGLGSNRPDSNPGGPGRSLGGGELPRRDLRRPASARDLRDQRAADPAALLRRDRTPGRPVRAGGRDRAGLCRRRADGRRTLAAGGRGAAVLRLGGARPGGRGPGLQPARAHPDREGLAGRGRRVRDAGLRRGGRAHPRRGALHRPLRTRGRRARHALQPVGGSELRRVPAERLLRAGGGGAELPLVDATLPADARVRAPPPSAAIPASRPPSGSAPGRLRSGSVPATRERRLPAGRPPLQ